MKLLLEDTFEYKTVPYLVKVEEREMYVNGKTGESRKVNIRGNPAGMGSSGRHWVVVDATVASVRPDYPYSIDQRWPENVEQHFRHTEPHEKVVRNGFLRGYATKPIEVSIDAQEMADTVIDKLKSAYKNRDEVETLK